MRHTTNPWVILVLICFAQFMVVLDATVVNVALPSIQRDLHMSEANLQWIVNAYTLVFGGFLLLGGRVGDLLGRKLFSLRLIPESRDEVAQRNFDVAGAITVTGGLMALVYAIVQAQQKGWGSAQTIGTFAFSAVLLVGFVFIELRASAPLVRLSIFRV